MKSGWPGGSLPTKSSRRKFPMFFVVVVVGGGRRRGRRVEVMGGGVAVTGGACGDKHKTPRSIALVPILIFLLNSAGRY